VLATKPPNLTKTKTDYRSAGVKAQPPVKIHSPSVKKIKAK
jgi:hypothetical protein